MPANELKDSIFQNNHKRIGFVQERSYYSRKCWKKNFLLLDNLNLQKKIPDSRNAKEHY